MGRTGKGRVAPFERSREDIFKQASTTPDSHSEWAGSPSGGGMESKAKAGRSRGIKIRRLGEHGFENDSLSLEGGEPYVYMHV